MPSPDLLGPSALLVAALVAVGVLWRSHEKTDADTRTQRDTAIAGWRAQTDATNRLADLIEDQQRNADRRQVRSILDWVLGRTPPDADDRVAKDAEVTEMAAKSTATERRVERLIRLARIDAELQVRKRR